MIKNSVYLFIGIICICFFNACENTVNKSDVIIQNAPKIVQETATTSFEVDVVRSTIKWMASLKIIPGEHMGNIKWKEGKLIQNGNEIIGGTLILHMQSINNSDLSMASENAKLVSSLKAAPVFYTDSFAVAKFDISSVAFTKDETKRAQPCIITGDLSIKGIRNSISFPAEIQNMDEEVRITANVKLEGKKWLLYESITDDLTNQAKKEVGINFDLQWNIIAKKSFH